MVWVFIKLHERSSHCLQIGTLAVREDSLDEIREVMCFSFLELFSSNPWKSFFEILIRKFECFRFFS